MHQSDLSTYKISPFEFRHMTSNRMLVGSGPVQKEPLVFGTVSECAACKSMLFQMRYGNELKRCPAQKKGETTLEALHKKKLHGGFPIRKAFCEVGVCSEYPVMPRIRRNAYQQVSEFDRGRIVAYRECALPLRNVTCRSGRNPNTVMRMNNQRVAESQSSRIAFWISTPFQDLHSRGHTYCKVGSPKLYNDITDH
ncbi:hypothetical protein TNCV_2654271 [Trichonephila clavipes]|nr:hypothetical protein TNCV_2654271 [Trichonephila clavipes]